MPGEGRGAGWGTRLAMSRQIGARAEPFFSIAFARHSRQTGAPGHAIDGVRLPSIQQVAQKSSLVAAIARQPPKFAESIMMRVGPVNVATCPAESVST
jgi:hypothetical protein